jgi:transposase InsO family protein
VTVVKEKVIDTSREDALKRFGLIAPLLEGGLSAAELAQRRCALLAREDISERTLRRWIASYRKKGFDGLLRQERKDKGQGKSIPKEALELAEEYRRELPRRSAGLICSLLEREGYKVARSTLERQLRLKGLSGKQLAAEANAGGTTRRFVRVGRNTLWQSDVKYGVYLPDPKNPKKKFRTYLLVIIDDATRLVVHGEFYADQKLPILEDGLRKAILRYGAPKSLYVDNGKIFTSTWLQLACARLNIRHLRTRPYSPEAKGKVERFNRTAEGFLSELSLQKANSLEELNRMFSAWLSEEYNNKPHSALNGRTPAEVFASDSAPLRFHSMEALADAFLHEAERLVDKTGCMYLNGTLYDAGIEWVRKKVTARFDPFNLEEVQLWRDGAMKKVIRKAKISEYNTPRQTIEGKPEKASESRVLKMFEKAQQERFKNIMGAFRMSSEED